MPYMAQVAIGNKPYLTIFGGDYDTVDGTGKKEHAQDFAQAPFLILEKMHEKLKNI